MTYTTWLDLTKAIESATEDIRKIELRPGYGYDPDSERICDEHLNVLTDQFSPRYPDIAAVRLEKRDGRRIWARKDVLLAIAHCGWPKSSCWVCGVKIPHLWLPDRREWVPDTVTERIHALTKKTAVAICATSS